VSADGPASAPPFGAAAAALPAGANINYTVTRQVFKHEDESSQTRKNDKKIWANVDNHSRIVLAKASRGDLWILCVISCPII
jgi:hypothetical protein